MLKVSEILAWSGVSSESLVGIEARCLLLLLLLLLPETRGAWVLCVGRVVT